ncbi:hypothetical protein [Oscillibacter sp.]|uniref:hypothetical protein n=1 Tax=Oscillibacter sp. TaxID=1945593 RepID=UPI00339B344C
MKSISVVKENPGILSREALEGTGYGLLCRAFALQILSRMSVTDGLYRQLALEFLKEPEPAVPAENEYHISLELILETLRKLEPPEGPERVRTERLLERVETRLWERTNAPERERPAPAEPRPMAVTLQNLLFRTMLQLSEAEKTLAFPHKTLSGAFLRAESAARAASAEAAFRAKSASTAAAANGQKRRIDGNFSASNVLAFEQSGIPTRPSPAMRMNSQNKPEAESLRINAPDAARPADAETVFATGKPQSESDLSPTQIAEAMERTLERRLREETARQAATAEQQRREPTAAVDRSAAAEPFREPKGSRPRAEEPSMMKGSQHVPPRSSRAKPEWKKDEPDRQTRAVGIEVGDDFHSLPADSGRKPGEPASQKHGFLPVNQDIRTAAEEKSSSAEHSQRFSGDPEPGKPLPRSLRIPQTQELIENSSSREIYIREPEELALREFHTPEPDAGKIGLSTRDSSEKLRQSAQQIFDGSESGGSAGKAAKPPVSENTAAGSTASPVSMATVSSSAAGEPAASGKRSAKDQTPTAEWRDSGREDRFSAPAPQTHGLSPVSRDIRTAAPAEKTDSAYPRQMFGAADPAADMVYSPETLYVQKTSAENAGLPEPTHSASKSELPGKAARGASTPVPVDIRSSAAAEARSESASIQAPAARQMLPKSPAELQPPETQKAERQSSGLRGRTAERSGHSPTAPTVNRDIRTAVRTGESANREEPPLRTFGASERTEFSPRALTLPETFPDNAGLSEKRETAYVGKEPKPLKFRTPESDVPERPTPTLRSGSLTNGPTKPGLPGPGRLAGKMENLPALNHPAAGATVSSISAAEVSAAVAGTASAPAKPFKIGPPRAAESAFLELVPFRNRKAPDSVSPAMPARAGLSPTREAENKKERSPARDSVKTEQVRSAPPRVQATSQTAALKMPRTMESAHPQELTPPRAAMPVSRDIRTAGHLTGGVPRGVAESAGASYSDASVPVLEYAPAAFVRQEPAEAPASQMDSEYVKSLPAWAQNFLKNSSVAENPDAGSAFPTAARDISVLPGSGGEAGQMRWAAAQRWMAPQRRPEELSFRQKEEPQTTRPQEKLSDTEIRHMADKVYKLIEDRIRRERRRLDL